jgi:hypothetical protein
MSRTGRIPLNLLRETQWPLSGNGVGSGHADQASDVVSGAFPDHFVQVSAPIHCRADMGGVSAMLNLKVAVPSLLGVLLVGLVGQANAMVVTFDGSDTDAWLQDQSFGFTNNPSASQWGAYQTTRTTSPGVWPGLNSTSAVRVYDWYDATDVYNNQSLDLTNTNNSYTVSAYFLKKNSSNIWPNSLIQLGVGSATSTTFNSSDHDYLTARITYDWSNYTFEFQTANGAGAASFDATTLDAGDLVNGQWYYLAVTVTPTAAGSFSAVASLYNSDSSGNVTGAPLASISDSTHFTDLTHLDDTEAYAGFRLGYLTGLQYMDNFAITTAAVPEPASLGALGLAGIGLLARRRRRRV